MSPAPPALDRLAPLLRCPVCSGALDPTDTGVACPAGHRFDRARQGYLTLLGGAGRRFPGDTADQVASRSRLLSSGAFDAILDAVAGSVVDGVGTAGPAVVLEAGAGTGDYLAACLEALGSRAWGLGTDLSQAAARRLARVHPRLAAVVADTWAGLPVADAIADALLVVFAPRHAAEFARLVRPGGALVVALPGPGHLGGLRERLDMVGVPGDKSEALDRECAADWEAEGVRVVDREVEVGVDTAVDLALMGPSGVHLDRDAARAALAIEGGAVRVHLDVRVHRYRRRPPR